ncbi:hypothetical protein FNV43_RR17885 [Rhamnella rubrinervis]|uniref:Dolichyl-diphosphooligosaccharide-protein glycosyltransferase subunit OST5 n=1 Tax=Rhamnella rubrinervis TaxID=2594499 RepID=A0A8K0DXY9_9ROSA|nr:hypothetical protein FNV43_RR17885 [Rhamnella rubrinervis]
MLAIGLIVTASFFIYEATSSRRNRSLAKELTTGAVASVFLGFGSLFLLISSDFVVASAMAANITSDPWLFASYQKRCYELVGDIEVGNLAYY